MLQLEKDRDQYKQNTRASDDALAGVSGGGNRYRIFSVLHKINILFWDKHL